ncbi:hypothetical protein CVT24_013048 [Panaeolus cyanescens]|uniref:RRM domain-containing protein n=1 Tax=Panaeolus cyanescens TaxID=181874 RepID=A0A409YUU3_9AGAR|nr:hypothetical protein CVT24_013048 [Panaeolus cyanescens]
MDQSYNQHQYGEAPRPHPYLHEPLLYITNLPPYVSDENLALAFVECGPFRPKIMRDGSPNLLSGTIEFKFLERAEKALTILQSRNIPGLMPPVPLVLSPYPPTTPPTPLPPPSALPRVVKQLPSSFNDSRLYDLFRPFGALASVRTQTSLGADIAIVEFWNEEDAIQAEEAMHCADVEGQNIAVQIYNPRRTTEFNIAAPSFVPAAVSAFSPFAAQQYSPPRANPYSPVRSPVPPPFVHGPGQQVQLAPISGPGANSHSGLIDPCNLFCKNLSPEIDSNKLFTAFHQFGQIVSARVMRNEHGESRGFGFVSYQTPEQANEALRAMNGATLGSKQIVVRLHEPKQLRQEKLAQRFGNGHPRRGSSGATSPAASEAGDYSTWNSPRNYPSSLGSPALSPKPMHHERHDRGRRGSGSYYTAALSGNLNVPMNYNSLSNLSPVVRKEVLTGELTRRVKGFEILPTEKDVDALVESLVTLSLSNVLQYLDESPKLREHTESYKARHASSVPEPPSRPSSEPVAQDANSGHHHDATASAPEHPSTPVSLDGSSLAPPRAASPAGSVPPLSEKDRVFAAIAKLESSRQTELTQLIMSLPKRERALCLFNPEVLKQKLADAKMVLDSDDGDGADEPTDAQSTQSAPVPVTPQTKKVLPPVEASPSTPDLSSRGASAVASPAPVTPGGAGGTTHTLASLAKLPAAEIIRLANSASATGLPLPKADPTIVQATDSFIDGILDKPLQAQKQALGEKLFKVVKSFGVKGAPKITIALLDQDDLRALAHLMNSYPSVLKEKILLMTAPQPR